MSLKSFSFACDTVANGEVPAQSTTRVNIKSPSKEPVAQNLLAQLMSGLSTSICKNMNKSPNNNLMETTTREEKILPKDDNDKLTATVFNSHPINLGCSYWKQRQRTLSEQSDDIYFLEDDANKTQNYEQNSTYYDDDDEEDSEDNEEDSEDNEEDSEDNEEDSEDNEDDEEDSEDEYTSNKIFGCSAQKLNDSVESLRNGISNDAEKSRRVRFNLNPEIHIMYAWSFAYKSARKGHWESLARDRDRFRKRIENTSKHINPILTPEHRSFIYNTRFFQNNVV